jgi:hypothetical protein
LYFKASDDGKGSNGGYVFYPVKVVTIEDSSSTATNQVEEVAVNDTSSDSEDVVVVDMSSDSNDESDTTDNANSVPNNDDSSSNSETSDVENSIPGFEFTLTVISISLICLLQRKTLK